MSSFSTAGFRHCTVSGDTVAGSTLRSCQHLKQLHAASGARGPAAAATTCACQLSSATLIVMLGSEARKMYKYTVYVQCTSYTAPQALKA